MFGDFLIFIFDDQPVIMKKIGKFILLEIAELGDWLKNFNQTRPISHIQQHHTWIPNYDSFNGNNHFRLCDSMEQAHLKRGFSEIAQNFTTFPDGTIMICRDLNIQPAGIANANKGGICIENVGDFDDSKDQMTDEHRQTIVDLTKALLSRFTIIPNDKTLVYHHWFDLKTGKRKLTDEPWSVKTCPGTNFFGGNTHKAYEQFFLPLFK